MGFLKLAGKTFVVFGVANKKSVGYVTGEVLQEEGARVIYVVRSEERKHALEKVLTEPHVYTCDVERESDIHALTHALEQKFPLIHGFVHSIAFANYADGSHPFHTTPRKDFLQAMQISCHSLVELANALKPRLDENGSVVALSISTTSMAAENYGYMAPVKAALDSSIVFLAKSFSRFSKIRFNAVCPGLLKTSSSAGIPGYVDSYLFAEQATLRKKGVRTREVADTIAFLLSERSAGINGQRIVVDAGMGSNYFDEEIVKKVTHDVSHEAREAERSGDLPLPRRASTPG
jgi:enoyl-[acyl-carrier protein] reductase I